MSEFRIGDRVQVVANNMLEDEYGYIGHVGSVYKVYPSLGSVMLRLDNEPGLHEFEFEEVEKID